MTPEYHDQEDFQIRLRKLKEIQELNIDPYPHKFTPKATAKTLHADFKEPGHFEEAESGKTPEATIAGRLVLFRAMGKNAFGHIQDATGRIQVMFNRDHTEVEGYKSSDEGIKPIKFIEKKIDLGDIIGLEGNLFLTQKGELTLYVKRLQLLTKTLLPLAEKHAGLAQKELRYRKRWLDLITNPDIQDTFVKRTFMIRRIRQFMEERGFLEVETPVLQSIYGGAEAKPFLTNLHALNQEMFMRISLEIPLKKLLVGGIDKVFEIGKVFRNEGIDRNHNPEFTLLEAYAAFWDYNDMMSLVETMVETLAIELYGSAKVPHTVNEGEEPIEINVAAPWPRLTMKEAIEKFGNLKVDTLTDDEIRKKLKEGGHIDEKKLVELTRGLLIAALFEVIAEPRLIQPHHIIDHPIETTPLCKPHRNPALRKEGLVERFESFIAGHELCNAYSELNDPVMQRRLLEGQAERREKGDEEASPLDEEFIEAICQGMPPAGGVGIGIDRLVMLLTDTHSIRDVLYFPWMKPQTKVDTALEHTHDIEQ